MLRIVLRHLCRIPFLSALVLLAIAAPSSAQWQPGGVRVCEGAECLGGFAAKIIGDGLGGVFITWVEARDYASTEYDLYLQHINAIGERVSGWPASGVAACTAAGSQGSGIMLLDNSGGVFVAWTDHRDEVLRDGDIYATRITADGLLAPGWGFNGTPVCTLTLAQALYGLAPDDAGGLYLLWRSETVRGYPEDDIYVQHLMQDGTIAPGWPENGLGVCTAPGDQALPHVVADQAGGILISWSDVRTGVSDIYAQHLNSDGTIAPGWEPNGKMIVGGPGSQGAGDLVADGEGGAFVGFDHQPSDIYSIDNYMQRFTGAGEIAPGWPSFGVPLAIVPDYPGGLWMIPDGLGGVIAMWQDYRDVNDDVYCQRVLPDGNIAPGWPVNGRAAIGPNPYHEDPGDIASDGTGGAFVAAEVILGSSKLFTQHLTAAGQPAPGWSVDGLNMGNGYHPAITSAGPGNAIVAWEGGLYIYAQKLVADGPVAVEVALVASEVTADHVRLVWELADRGIADVAVYRRRESGDWHWVATVPVDGTGRVSYEDRDVVPGERYAYRLGWAGSGGEQTSTETLIEVPAALTLALEGLRPNPSRGPLTVAFTLERAVPATLELLDVSGRRRVSREVGSLGPGQHMVRLEPVSPLEPGMYFVRLTAPGRTLIARGAVIR